MRFFQTQTFDTGENNPMLYECSRCKIVLNKRGIPVEKKSDDLVLGIVCPTCEDRQRYGRETVERETKSLVVLTTKTSSQPL
jgi:DNA-directed RNA polymerase subunit RPC12/RpoP